jgi:hypothetical protein
MKDGRGFANERNAKLRHLAQKKKRLAEGQAQVQHTPSAAFKNVKFSSFLQQGHGDHSRVG